MQRFTKTQPRWVIGATIGALIISAIVAAGPGGANAQDATPIATATETVTAEPTATAKDVAQADVAADFTVGDVVSVADGPLNLRETASIDGTVVTQLATSEQVTIKDGPTTSGNYDWYQVETTASETGWVAGEFLVAESITSFVAGDSIVVTDGPLNLRDSGDMSGTVVTQLATSDTATILDGPVASDGLNWYEIEIDGDTSGWVAADFIDAASSGTASFTAGDMIAVSDGPLNVRSEAGISSDVVTQLQTSDTATIVSGPEAADDYSWYEVEIDSDTSGWVASDFIGLAGNESSDISIAIGDGVRVAVDGANFRAEAGLDADVIDTLDGNALLLVQDGPVEADGYTWYKVFNYYYGEGWVASSVVTVDPNGFPAE